MTSPSKCKAVVVVAPHIDDEAIGCGGSIIKHIEAGNSVSVVYVCDGGISREKEARKSAASIGIKNVYFFRERSRSLIISPKLMEKMAAVLCKILPDYVYAPHDMETDADHRGVSEVMKEAVWMYEERCGHRTEAVLLYEVWTPMQDFNYTEDISGIINRKKCYIRQFFSQLAARDYACAAVGLNEYRGKMFGGCGYAEVFKVKKIRSLGMFGKGA